jgi:hypothetical protein
MPDSTIAGVISATATSVVALIVGVGGTWVAVSTRRSAIRKEKADEERSAALDAKLQENIMKTDEIHVMVNQDRTNKINFIAALIRTIVAAGLEVPIDQSLGTLPESKAP